MDTDNKQKAADFNDMLATMERLSKEIDEVSELLNKSLDELHQAVAHVVAGSYLLN